MHLLPQITGQLGVEICLSKALFQKKSMNTSAFIQKNHGRYNLLKSVEYVEEKLTSLDYADAIREGEIDN